MHEMQENRSLTWEEKLGEAWRNLVEKIWGREESVWERKQRSIEKDIEKWQADCTRSLNRALNKSRQMRCRGGVESSVEQVSRKATSTNHVSRNCRGIKTLEVRYEARLIHQLSRCCLEVRNFLDRSTRYRGADEIAIRKSLGSLIDSWLLKRCRASFSK